MKPESLDIKKDFVSDLCLVHFSLIKNNRRDVF